MKIKAANLKVGDIFEYRGVMYEVLAIRTWSVFCQYVNNLYGKQWFADKYLYCDISKHTKVEI